MNSNGVLNSNRFVEKLGIQMLLRNVVIYILLFTHHSVTATIDFFQKSGKFHHILPIPLWTKISLTLWIEPLPYISVLKIHLP